MRTLKDWIIATRPWSFPASFIPVLAVGSFLTYSASVHGPDVNWLHLMIAVLMMVVFQAAGNLVSDYYDHVRGVDLAGSLNQVRDIQSGKFTPRELLVYGYCVLAAGVLIGILLLILTSWKWMWLGAVAVFAVTCYMWLKAHVLGDLTILLCYAILPAAGASLVGTGSLNSLVLPICLPFGLLTVAILHANNTRDIRNDRRAGVLSFAGWIGGSASKGVYIAEIVAPFVLTAGYCLAGWTPWWSLLTWLTIPLAWPLVKKMASIKPEEAEAIAAMDQQTAKLQLSFGLLYILSFLIAAL